MIKSNVILGDNSWGKYLKNPNSFISKKIKILNKKEKLFKRKNFFFTLLLSSTEEIKKLNKRFRKKNKSTDILSFPFYNQKQLHLKIRKEKEIYLGDIIINLKKIEHKNNKKSFYIKFDKLWVHGLVHLFGYKHKTDREYKKMRRIEKRYLKQIN